MPVATVKCAECRAQHHAHLLLHNDITSDPQHKTYANCKVPMVLPHEQPSAVPCLHCRPFRLPTFVSSTSVRRMQEGVNRYSLTRRTLFLKLPTPADPCPPPASFLQHEIPPASILSPTALTHYTRAWDTNVHLERKIALIARAVDTRKTNL